MRLPRTQLGPTAIALAFVLAPVLCCCPVKQAAASINTSSQPHNCCPEKQSSAPAPPVAPAHDDCDCGGRLAMAEPDTHTPWTAPADAHLLPVAAFVPVAFHQHTIADAHLIPHAIDRHPPPIPDSLLALHCMLTT